MKKHVNLLDSFGYFISSMASCRLKEKGNTIQQEAYYCKISVCKRMVRKHQKLGVFALACELNSNGIKLNRDSLSSRGSFDNNLRKSHSQELFKKNG